MLASGTDRVGAGAALPGSNGHGRCTDCRRWRGRYHRADLCQAVAGQTRPAFHSGKPDRAGATIGTAYVAQAAPDGYTLLLMESSAPVAKWLYKNKLPLTLRERFHAMLKTISSNPLVLFANPSLPAKDLKELIVYAKDNPTSLSAGVSGTIHQLAAAMLNAAAAITITAVSYRGTAPAVNDILSGTSLRQRPATQQSPLKNRQV